MMWILFGITIFIIILIMIALIIIICLKQKNINKLKELLIKESDCWSVEHKQVQFLEATIKNLEDNNDYLKNQLETALQNNNDAEEALRSRYNALTTNVAAAEQQLEQLNKDIHNRTSDLNNIAAQFKDMHDQLMEASAQNVAAASQLDGYKLELNKLIKELDDAKETSRVALLNDYQNESKWFDFDLSNKEIKLIETIKEIASLYPELTKDLANIEWKKLWLPKVQDISNTYRLAVRGIYRLVLKENESVCYVGQSTSIKDRWYEHIKKMLGADTSAGEKLYKYRPEDFYWTVLETETNDLNTAEKYWIEFYCCKEVGLNKKV